MFEKELQIILRCKDEASKTIGGFKGKLQELKPTFKKMAIVGTAAFAAVTGAIVGLIKKSSEFEKAISNVNTLFDDNGEAAAKLKDGILELMKSTPKSAEDLGESAYDIVSAGITDTAEALSVLKSSSNLAVAGLGETAEATDIITSAINAFGLDAGASNEIANTFFLAVKSGKTTVSDLAQGFGQVAPLAESMNMSLDDLVSTTAAMTTSGMNASVAYTGIKGALSNLLKPTKDMQDVYDELGWSVDTVTESIGEKGLTETLRILADQAGNNTETLGKMFGSVEGLNSVMMLLGETGDNASEIMNTMSDNSGALTEAFNKQTETTDALYQMTKNNLEVAMISVGDKFKEIAIGILPFIDKLSEWAQINPELVKSILIIVGALGGLIAIAGILGGILPLIIAGFGFILSPVGLVIIGIIALIAVIVSLIKNWDKTKEAVIILWSFIKDFLKKTFNSISEFIKEIWDNILEFFKSIWDKIKARFEFALALIVGIVSAIFEALGIDIFAIWENIKNALEETWGNIKEVFSTALNFIKDLWTKMWNSIKDFLSPVIETIKGYVSAVWVWIKNKFTDAVEPIKNVWKGLWEGIKNIFVTIWGSIKSMIVSGINGFIGMINGVISAINNVVSKGASVLGLSDVLQIGNIPYLADGGIVNRPTLAMVGEAGPEAVIPLSKAGFGGGITVNINGGNFLSENVADELAKNIISKLKMQGRV